MHHLTWMQTFQPNMQLRLYTPKGVEDGKDKRTLICWLEYWFANCMDIEHCTYFHMHIIIIKTLHEVSTTLNALIISNKISALWAKSLMRKTFIQDDIFLVFFPVQISSLRMKHGVLYHIYFQIWNDRKIKFILVSLMLHILSAIWITKDYKLRTKYPHGRF